MSRRTSGGRARRSRRLDPIQITGLSASVMPIYVYLYTRKEAGRAILPGRACSFNQRFTARQYSLGLLTFCGPYAYPCPVLLARGAVMGRCEGGAAVGREAGDAAFRAHRVGPKGPVDAAPAGRLTHSVRSGGPGQPSAGITTGCPQLYGARAARGGDEGAAATAP